MGRWQTNRFVNGSNQQQEFEQPVLIGTPKKNVAATKVMRC